MATLNTDAEPAGAGRLLRAADRDRTATSPTSESALVNAKLVLLLANHIGDADVLAQALAAAREDVVPADPPADPEGATDDDHDHARPATRPAAPAAAPTSTASPT